MQAILAALGKALIGALPQLAGAIWKKIIFPIVGYVLKIISNSKLKKVNREKANKLEDAKNEQDINDTFGDMP